MSTNLKSLFFSLRIFLGNYPKLFFPIYGIIKKNRELFINNQTEMVVSAYPRTANTFFIVALKHIQDRKLEIAHHLHVPALTILGIKKKIPTIVLIREPYSCITSLIIREKHITISQAIKSYLDFYENALKYKDLILVVEFETITNNFSQIITSINEKFNLSLNNYTKEKPLITSEIFKKIDDINKRFNKNKLVESKVSRPSEGRKKESELYKRDMQKQEYKVRLEKCLSLYEELIK